MTPHWRRWMACGPLAAALAAGCDTEPPRVPVQPVTGSVTVGGAPAARALVRLVPLENRDPNALRPRAVSGDDGRFSLGTYGTGDGVPEGEYAVTVIWSGGKGGKAAPGAFAGGDAFVEGQPRDALGGRYADPATTKLRVKIDKGTTELPPFKL